MVESLAPAPPPFPEKVGKYELLLPIGTGGMATVYLARSTGVGGFERDVALKLVHAHLRTDEESKLQLLEEAKLAARIRHPNVVPVLEIDEDPLGLFLVMDYVEGDTLSGLTRACRSQGRSLPRPLIARILNDALLGLHAAHELTDETGKPLRLVHRDFSPQNILVSVQGVTRLTDFGVAKAADRAVRTKTGLVKGKISYMSPEQARGHALDRRCDVWAAGVVAWELIAGKRMHRSDDDVATLLSIVTEDPPRLRSVVPDVPKPLDDAVAWALTPDVAKRCKTAEEFRKTLVQAFDQSSGMAEAQDLARFVQQVVNPKLEERRASVAEVRTLRRRMVQLASPRKDDESDSNASEVPPQPGRYRTPLPRAAKSPMAKGAPAPLTGTETRRDLASPNFHEALRAGSSEVPNGADSMLSSLPGPARLPEDLLPGTPASEGTEHTETSVVVPFLTRSTKDTRRWIIGGVLLSAVVVGLSVIAFSEPEPLDVAATMPGPSGASEGEKGAHTATQTGPDDPAHAEPSPETEPPATDALPTDAKPGAPNDTEQTAATPTSDRTQDDSKPPRASAPPAPRPIRVKKPRPSPPERDEGTRRPRPGKPELADSPYAKPEK